MLIRDLFLSDVTRDIPPVVYFHEQEPAKLRDEVNEYIVTGGWPHTHQNHRRVPDGIHEQYVRLLTNIRKELDKPGGTDLPSCWISGFYGSGKSSFAKLLGLALDGAELPGGESLSKAWLRRDMSPNAEELTDAWNKLRQKIDPLAVVFDIGGIARDNEHIHAAAVRQVQCRLGYCSTQPLVADFELSLERDGEWSRFEEIAEATLGKPWKSVKDTAQAEEDFSLVMSVMRPDRYTDPMSWFVSRAGTHEESWSANDAMESIRDMLRFRRPGATLFLVIDEVSQYVLPNEDRQDKLRAFASALGSGLRGQVWLLAIGQQRIEETAGNTFHLWAKDRFPPQLRVHLAPTNIRDVVHRRLLQKKPEVEKKLHEVFEKYRTELQLYAYGCDSVTAEEFTEVYPMLPGQVDLILQITSAMRTRSKRAQGDDQAIRGLLQLLGELFRGQELAEKPFGTLVTLDQVYDVQHTALDADVQNSMARVLTQCADDADGLLVRAAKTVALLELLQETLPTDAKLVAQCLYGQVGSGNQIAAVTEALEELRRRNLLGYSEKNGYKLQSSAGEEWERDRREISVPSEAVSEIVQKELSRLLGTPERPRHDGRPFPWAGQFSDGRRADDVTIADPRVEAVFRVDFRYLPQDERDHNAWVKRSGETALHNRLVWVCGDIDKVEENARELYRSRALVQRYQPRFESLNSARKLLLQEEKIRVEELEKVTRDEIAAAWMNGTMYFRGGSVKPHDHGATFARALEAVATRQLPNLYPHHVATQVVLSELLHLVKEDLSGPSPKFLPHGLGILEPDSGRLVATCSGAVPQRVQAYIDKENGLSGTLLLAYFGRPPYGYTENVVKACVAGLLRGGKIRIQPDGGQEITAYRDAGVTDVFERDREFRRATIFPAGEDDVGPATRARICKFFEKRLHVQLDRENHAIAEAVARLFPEQSQKLRGVLSRLNQLPGDYRDLSVFDQFAEALEACVRNCRQTKPTVLQVMKHLNTLQDGVARLNAYDAELTPEAIEAVRAAHDVLVNQAAQLRDLGATSDEVDQAANDVAAQLRTGRPWLTAPSLDEELSTIRDAYVRERLRLLQWQEEETEAAKIRLKTRKGFSTLTGEQSHLVLRPFAAAATDTSEHAVAPALAALRDPFTVALQRAENEANEILDKILSAGDTPLITRLDLGLHNREVATEADVTALVEEIRGRLLDQIRSGTRVRLL